jgi:hypothetical protein
VQASREAVGGGQEKAGLVVSGVGLVKRVRLGRDRIRVGVQLPIVAGISRSQRHHFPPGAQAKQEVG